jgi:WD40 repeat protein
MKMLRLISLFLTAALLAGCADKEENKVFDNPADPGGTNDFPHMTLTGHTDRVRSVFVSGNYIVSGSDDATIKVWNLSTGNPVKTLAGHVNNVLSVFVSGDYVVSAAYGGTIKVWRLSTGVAAISTIPNCPTVIDVKVAPDGTKIVAALGSQNVCRNENTIKIIDRSSGSTLMTIRGHTSSVFSVSVSGDYIVSGSYDRTIRVWRLSTGTPVSTIPVGEEVHDVKVTSDGTRIVAAIGDDAGHADENTVKVFNFSTGSALMTLRGHTDDVYSVFVSGDYVVSGSADNTIKVWRLSTGSLVSTITGHTGPVYSVAVSGDYIVSGSADRTIKVWRAPW